MIKLELNKIDLGKKGEEFVIEYLRKQGFIIIAQNYRQRFGEIDIIAQKHEVLAFVEVKLRKDIYFMLSEVINLTKQRKIIKAAKFFISTNNFKVDLVFRFDVALLELKNDIYKITYIPDAFRSEA